MLKRVKTAGILPGPTRMTWPIWIIRICAAWEAPAFGARKTAILQDIALATGNGNVGVRLAVEIDQAVTTVRKDPQHVIKGYQENLGPSRLVWKTFLGSSRV